MVTPTQGVHLVGPYIEVLLPPRGRGSAKYSEVNRNLLVLALVLVWALVLVLVLVLVLALVLAMVLEMVGVNCDSPTWQPCTFLPPHPRHQHFCQHLLQSISFHEQSLLPPQAGSPPQLWRLRRCLESVF